jgi:hypothetical protein
MSLKIYDAAEASNSFVPPQAGRLAGNPRNSPQCSFAVVEATKKAALATLAEADFGAFFFRTSSSLRIAMGNDVEALTLAGALQYPGTVLVWDREGVVRHDGGGVYSLIGHLKYARPSEPGYECSVYGTYFVPLGVED